MGNELFLGIGLITLATLVGSAGALFFKDASRHARKSLSALLKKPALYLGFLFYGSSALLYTFALGFGELSALYPVAGLSYVWISLLSVRFLKERMNELKWFGICLILVGVAFVGLSA